MSHYNLSAVEETAEGDQDFILVVIQTFLEEVPPDVVSMNEAIKNGNSKLAYQFAHKIKPNLKLFGLDLLEQIQVIEKWAKQGKVEHKVPEAASIITDQVTLICGELRNDYNL
ncbi:Hpt domain-containing protein [Zunongwangia sp.]|uniref:Hpt domain-containing protein n=1 Tax=Zunongwangia sp. TaxID=1965325 RepID=UPI003AA866F9